MDAMDFWRTPSHVRKDYVWTGLGQIHFRENSARGESALPLVCLHAAPVSGWSLGLLLEALGDSRYGVAIDLPGYGLSAKPDAAPTIEQYAAWMAEAIDRLGLGEFAVLGALTGAKIATALALALPDRVKAVVYAGLPPLGGTAGAKVSFGPVPLREDGEHFFDFWQELDRAKGTDRPPAAIQRDVADALLPYPDHWWGYQASASYDLGPVLPQIRQPALVFVPNTPMKPSTLEGAALLPSGEVIENKAWGGGFLETDASNVSTAIDEFLGDAKISRLLDPIPNVPSPEGVPVVRAYADGPFGQIHYRRVGRQDDGKTPLVCFHASPQSGLVFETFAKEMGRDRLTIAPDTPGFGESDWPLTEPSIEDFAGAMASLLDGIGVQRADVMGFHTGAMTAIEIACQRPDLVRKVVMISAPIFTDEELAQFRAHYKPLVYKPDGSHNVAAWQSFWPWRGPRQSIENYARSNFQTLRGGPVKHWGHQAAFNYPLAERMAKVDQSILVLNPNDDVVEQTRRAAPLMKRGQIHELPDHGHGMLDSDTQEVAGLVRAFLD